MCELGSFVGAGLIRVPYVGTLQSRGNWHGGMLPQEMFEKSLAQCSPLILILSVSS